MHMVSTSLLFQRQRAIAAGEKHANAAGENLQQERSVQMQRERTCSGRGKDNLSRRNYRNFDAVDCEGSTATQSTASKLSSMLWLQHLRTQEVLGQVQGKRWRQHVQAQSTALQVQGISGFHHTGTLPVLARLCLQQSSSNPLSAPLLALHHLIRSTGGWAPMLPWHILFTCIYY